MITALFRLAFSEPDLLAQHVDAYADLIKRDMHAWQMQLRKSILCWAIALLGGVAGFLLGGVALMMWALHAQQGWILLVVPLIPVAAGLIAFTLATKRTHARSGFSSLYNELRQDMHMLRNTTP